MKSRHPQTLLHKILHPHSLMSFHYTIFFSCEKKCLETSFYKPYAPSSLPWACITKEESTCVRHFGHSYNASAETIPFDRLLDVSCFVDILAIFADILLYNLGLSCLLTVNVEYILLIST